MSEYIHDYQEYESISMGAYYRGDELKSWEILFLYEFNSDPSNYPPPRPSSTARQKEQRKLASQLRSITGMIGLLRPLKHNLPYSYGYRDAGAALDNLRLIEHELRFAMSTIKQRIPA